MWGAGGGLIVSENYHQTAKATATSQLGGNEGRFETEIQLCGDGQKPSGRLWCRACVRARPPALSASFTPRVRGAGPTRTPGGRRSLFTGPFFQQSRSLRDGDPEPVTRTERRAPWGLSKATAGQPSSELQGSAAETTQPSSVQGLWLGDRGAYRGSVEDQLVLKAFLKGKRLP